MDLNFPGKRLLTPAVTISFASHVGLIVSIVSTGLDSQKMTINLGYFSPPFGTTNTSTSYILSSSASSSSTINVYSTYNNVNIMKYKKKKRRLFLDDEQLVWIIKAFVFLLYSPVQNAELCQ